MNKMVSVLVSFFLMFDPFILSEFSFASPVAPSEIVTPTQPGGGLSPLSMPHRLGGNCGPKVLKMIFSRLGLDVSLEKLIKATHTDKGMTTFKGLIDGAHQYGFLGLAVRTNTQDLEKMLHQNLNVICHFGGNNHYILINKIDDKWVYAYNPAKKEGVWKIPKKVFSSVWKGIGLVIFKPESVYINKTSLGLTMFMGASTLEVLNLDQIQNIRGGQDDCANTGDCGGSGDRETTGEPVELSRGNFYMQTEDLSIPALGPDLVLERTYNAQLFSDIEGWQPECGSGSWYIVDGSYRGHGDRTRSTNTWDDFEVSLSVKTIEEGESYNYEVAWVNFRYQDQDNRYYFLIKTNGDLEVTRVNSGTATNLASKASSYNPLNANTVKIRADGSLINVWVNNNLEITITDANPITSAGSIVLENYFSHASFDDVTVTPLPSGTTSSWTFSNDDNDGMFGRGWRSNLEMNLILRNNGDVWVRRGNDRRNRYIWNTTTSTWSAPKGTQNTLTETASGYDLTTKDGTVYHFNGSGRLNTIQDRYDNTLTISYTTVAGKERIDEVMEATGRTLEFTYDNSTGRCTQVTDPLSRTVTYTYNASGLLESATDMRGNTREYTYDSYYRMTQYTDRENQVYQYSYYYNNHIASQKDPELNETTFEYLWETTQVTDAASNTWTYEFNEDSQLVSKTDPEGNTTTYDWDEDYNLLSETDPNNHQTQYTYDSKGNKLSLTDPNDEVEHWTYESTYNQITSYTDKLDHTTSITYDAHGNPTQVEDPLGNTIQASYTSQGLMTTVTDRRGFSTTITYDNHGYLAGITNALNKETTYTYDDGGRLTQVEDPLNRITQFEYDDNNNLTDVTDSANHTTTYTYDKNDNKTKMTNPLNKETNYTYNAFNKLESVTDPLNRTTEYTYHQTLYMLTGELPLAQITDPANSTTTFTRDKIGRLTNVEDALSHDTGYTLDDAGNTTKITDAKSEETNYTYNSLDQVVTTSYSDGTTEVLYYDEGGNIIEKKLRDGKTISYTYNARNELIERRVNSYEGIYLNWNTWEVGDQGNPWELDNFELKVTMQTINPGQDTWHTSRIYFRRQDADNLYYFLIKTDGGIELVRRKNGNQTWLDTHLTSYDPTDLNAIKISMDSNNRIKIWINGHLEIDYTDQDPVTGNGKVVLEGHASYDYFDNVQLKDTDTSTVGAWYSTILDEYTRDANGNVTQITRNGTKNWTFTYDALNRITETEDSEGRTVSYTYDDSGRMNHIDYPCGLDFTYTYNSSGLLFQVKDTATTYVEYAYDAANQRTRRTLGNGVQTVYQYDDAGELLNLTTTHDSTTLASYGYTYDNLGNRTAQHDSTGTSTYTYDDLSQLTQAAYPSSITKGYTYDEVYNRTQLDINGTATDYTITTGHKVILSETGTASSVAYTWDPRGNISNKIDASTTTTYTHNLLNQLTLVEQTSQEDVIYEYDPLGRRITKTVGETVYHYTWSGDQLIEIRDGDGNLLKFIIYGNNLDEPIVMIGGASTDYFTTDGLGSISEITNEYGGLEEYYTYDAYGAPSLFDGTGTPISTSAVNNPFYFTGREYDFETGIYYYRARYYDPALGRFLETDPLGYIDSPNLYAYVGNNPWNWVDPWGLCGEKNPGDMFSKFIKDFQNKLQFAIFDVAIPYYTYEFFNLPLISQLADMGDSLNNFYQDGSFRILVNTIGKGMKEFGSKADEYGTYGQVAGIVVFFVNPVVGTTIFIGSGVYGNAGSTLVIIGEFLSEY